MALAMATAAAAAAFSTPQARRRRSRKHRRRYCDHNCDDASGRYRRGSVNGNEGIGDDGSYLTLDVREMVIDADPGSGGSGGRDVVTLSWHITEDVNPLDWIGLYFAGEYSVDHLCGALPFLGLERLIHNSVGAYVQPARCDRNIIRNDGL